MRLIKYKLGELVEPVCIRCGIPQCEIVSGINIFKRFMSSRNVGADTSNYLIVPHGCFAFNLMHVGRDEKIPVAMNDTNENIIVSSAYFVFKVSDESNLLREYLYMMISTPEFDRYAWFCTDSSVRGNLDWNRFCEIEVSLPPLPIQRKFVDVYNTMLTNQRIYESGLEDLKLTCDVYIENLRRTMPLTAIGYYISPRLEKNTELKVTVAQGVNTEKFFVPPRQIAEDKKNAQIVRTGQFAYNMATTRNGEKISIAYRYGCDCVVSSAYQVFEIDRKDELLPEYLMMWFKRSEFDRYARYHSWGSAHEFFTFEDMCAVKFPIPDIDIQKSIVNIYSTYITRREINEKLKSQIKNICPILIKGAMEETR